MINNYTKSIEGDTLGVTWHHTYSTACSAYQYALHHLQVLACKVHLEVYYRCSIAGSGSNTQTAFEVLPASLCRLCLHPGLHWAVSHILWCAVIP